MYNCYSGVHLRLLFSALDINDWILIHPWQDTGVKEFYLRERTREREREREREKERERERERVHCALRINVWIFRSVTQRRKVAWISCGWVIVSKYGICLRDIKMLTTYTQTLCIHSHWFSPMCLTWLNTCSTDWLQTMLLECKFRSEWQVI